LGYTRIRARSLTAAALVALLTESQPLARCVARAWIPEDVPDPGEVAVRIQRPVGGHVGWVDLELDVRAPERGLK
jgi:hypothetical protein